MIKQELCTEDVTEIYPEKGRQIFIPKNYKKESLWDTQGVFPQQEIIILFKITK